MPIEINTTDITSGMQEAYADDKPLFVPANVLANTSSTFYPDWRDEGSFIAGDSVTAAGYSGLAAIDGYGDVPTKPDETTILTLDTVYLVFSLVAARTNIDSLAIIGHNFGDFGGNLAITAQAANGASFLSGLIDLATATPAEFDNRRLAWFDLDDFKRYKGVRAFRLKLEHLDGNFPFSPIVGEVFAGERLQMSRRPNRPWDPRQLASDVPSAVGLGGAVSKYVRYKNKRVLSPTWTPTFYADEIYNINDHENLVNWHRKSTGGSGLFLFCDAPSSEPEGVMLMHCPDSTFTAPEQDVLVGDVSIRLEEQPPFQEDEDYEFELGEVVTTYNIYLATSSDKIDYGYVAGFDLATSFRCAFDLRATDLGGGLGTTIHVLSSDVTNPLRHFHVHAANDGSFTVYLGIPGAAPNYYAGSTMQWQSATGLLADGVWANLDIDYDGSRTGNDRLRVEVDNVRVETGGTYSATPPANLGNTAGTATFHIGGNGVGGTASYQIALDNLILEVGATTNTFLFENVATPESGGTLTPTPSGSIVYEERD